VAVEAPSPRNDALSAYCTHPLRSSAPRHRQGAGPVPADGREPQAESDGGGPRRAPRAPAAARGDVPRPAPVPRPCHDRRGDGAVLSGGREPADRDGEAGVPGMPRLDSVAAATPGRSPLDEPSESWQVPSLPCANGSPTAGIAPMACTEAVRACMGVQRRPEGRFDSPAARARGAGPHDGTGDLPPRSPGQAGRQGIVTRIGSPGPPIEGVSG
jgi:hypothetical protein